ncbi:MAG: DUF4281 domain-containing protein [Rhodospirillales bacterium]|nr:DUF4281 domain-containing protein [Rhodospirillales bacterium]
MTLDLLFKLGNMTALAGWGVLLASPFLPRLADRVAGLAIPLLLAVAYAGLVLAFWTGAEGGFGTLRDVMRLFDDPGVALAGWLHYLAFDLLVGAWVVRTARAEGIAFALAAPCLALTFLFGPAGYFAFSCLRGARALQAKAGAIAADARP